MNVQTNNLWRIVDKKYGVQWDHWYSEVVAGSYNMEVWKFIRGGWDLFSKLTDMKLEIVLEFAFGMIDDMVICYWKILTQNYFILLLIQMQLCLICLDFSFECVTQIPKFTRLAKDWDLESIDVHVYMLYETKVRWVEEDRMIWGHAIWRSFRSGHIIMCLK